MRADLRFRVGSLTKPLVAAVVLQLVAEGRLSLEDTVERWLPGILPYGDRLAVGRLLNHTSGVPDYTQPVYLALYQSAEAAALLGPARPGRPGGRPAAAVGPGRRLVVRQHRLHPARG